MDCCNRPGGTGPEQRSLEFVDVITGLIILHESHTGGHLKQIAQLRMAILGVGKLWHVGGGGIVDRPDRALGHCDANQQAGQPLRHRL